MALGPVASLGLAFSLGFPTSPSLHLAKAGSESPVEASHSAFPPPYTHTSPFGERDVRLGRMACWKSLKYMQVSANTLLNHGVSPPRWYI